MKLVKMTIAVIFMVPAFTLALYQKNEKNECVEFSDSLAKKPDYRLIGCEKTSSTDDKITVNCKGEALVVIYPDIVKCIKDGGSGKSSVAKSLNEEEVTYRRLQATPEKYIGKLVVVRAEISKYDADRGVLHATFGGESDYTSSPCIYANNNLICFAVPKNNQIMTDYLIDELKPDQSSIVKILGKLSSKKVFNIEEIRFCNSTTIACEPYAKVLK